MPDPTSTYVSKPFRPDAATLARLLADLTDSDLTLRQIARDFHTDLFQLNAFLASSPALAEAHHAAALRIRLAAAAQLPEVLTTLLTMVRSYHADADRLRPDTPENRIRLVEHARDARRAAHLLFRLANYNPRPMRIRATDIPPQNHTAADAGPRDVGAATPAAPHPSHTDRLVNRRCDASLSRRSSSGAIPPRLTRGARRTELARSRARATSSPASARVARGLRPQRQQRRVAHA